MSAVTIHDWRPLGGGNVMAFDLIDILRLAERDVRTSALRCRNVECMGELAEELHRVSDTGITISGQEMLQLASNIRQTIDGNFEATRDGENHPWLVVRAVDSTLYVVITEDRRLLGRIRERFRDVRNSPEDADYLA